MYIGKLEFLLTLFTHSLVRDKAGEPFILPTPTPGSHPLAYFPLRVPWSLSVLQMPGSVSRLLAPVSSHD